MDVLIKNGLIVTADGESRADLLAADGLISVIGPDLDPPEGTEVFDAEGLLVLPGGVDVHTHLDLTVGRAKVSDGWFAGSLAAAHGGTTTVVEHPGFGPNGCPPDYQLEIYKKTPSKRSLTTGFTAFFNIGTRRSRPLCPGWSGPVIPASKPI